MELTLEQQFALARFKSEVERMTEDQAKHFLVELYQQSLIKDALYRDLLKRSLT